MRRKASSRLFVPVLLAFTLLAPFGIAAAEEGGTLGDLFRELLGESETAPAPAPAPQPAAPAPAPATVDSKRVPFGRAEMELSFAPLVKNTAPAVVNVYASQKVAARSPFAGDPFFEQFFGDQRMPPRVQQSLGSGVLVDPSGIVVTNFHVIRDADTVKVATSDGREFTSKTLLKDESLDLAVLKIEAPQPFPVIGIGNSDALEVGDLVLAIGDPFGVGQTTTSGIVSALARSNLGISDFGFFIQTDAAINPGNSGGALINMRGELVGINTAIYSRSGGSIGIGFAIPSNMVRAVVASAKSGNDYFERPYIGATFDAVTAQIAEALGLDKPSGALISDVIAGGPAAKAGLKPGDVVLGMNGAPIEHVEALGYRLATQPIGATASFDVLSQGERKTVAGHAGARACRNLRRRSVDRRAQPVCRRQGCRPVAAACPAPWPQQRDQGRRHGRHRAQLAGRRLRLPAARHRARGQWRGNHLARTTEGGRRSGLALVALHRRARRPADPASAAVLGAMISRSSPLSCSMILSENRFPLFGIML